MTGSHATADTDGTGPTHDSGADAVDDRVLGRWIWGQLRASWPLLAVVVAIVVAAVLTAARPDDGLPLAPTSHEPDGTAALVDVLRTLGRAPRVVRPDAIGDADVVLLLRDQLTEAQRGALRSGIRRGARLVVTDPASPLAPEAVAATGLLDRVLTRDCAVPALGDSARIRPGGGARYEVPDGAVGCFAGDEGAWAVVTPMGGGHVVSLGGPAPLTNGQLGAEDNAVLAVQLLTPAGDDGPTIVAPVLRSPGEVDGGSDGLGALVPPGIRRTVLQLLLAFGVLVMWRARRLGRPLVEVAPVKLAASELTTAVGALLARNGTGAAAAQRIAGDTRRRLALRLGLSAAAAVDEVAVAIAARTGQDATAIAALLDPAPPSTDAALLDVTVALSALEQTVHTTLSPLREPVDVD